MIAFEQVDESHIPQYRIMHLGSDDPHTDDAQEDHRYPFAGEANPKVIIGVVKVSGCDP
jgi:dipeptidyl-peptidase-4